jgi:hypothetical protein
MGRHLEWAQPATGHGRFDETLIGSIPRRSDTDAKYHATC